MTEVRPVRRARPADPPGFLAPAAEVEHSFGPTAAEPGLRSAGPRRPYAAGKSKV